MEWGKRDRDGRGQGDRRGARRQPGPARGGGTASTRMSRAPQTGGSTRPRRPPPATGSGGSGRTRTRCRLWSGAGADLAPCRPVGLLPARTGGSDAIGLGLQCEGNRSSRAKCLDAETTLAFLWSCSGSPLSRLANPVSVWATKVKPRAAPARHGRSPIASAEVMLGRTSWIWRSVSSPAARLVAIYVQRAWRTWRILH
jgi:hypothetical protein